MSRGEGGVEESILESRGHNILGIRDTSSDKSKEHLQLSKLQHRYHFLNESGPTHSQSQYYYRGHLRVE